MLVYFKHMSILLIIADSNYVSLVRKPAYFYRQLTYLCKSQFIYRMNFYELMHLNKNVHRIIAKVFHDKQN